MKTLLTTLLLIATMTLNAEASLYKSTSGGISEDQGPSFIPFKVMIGSRTIAMKVDISQGKELVVIDSTGKTRQVELSMDSGIITIDSREMFPGEYLIIVVDQTYLASN